MIVKNVFTKLALLQIKPYGRIKDFGERGRKEAREDREREIEGV